MIKSKKLKIFCIVVVVVLTIASLVGCSSNKSSENKNKSESSYEDINAKETEDLLSSGDDIAVVDVRSKGEYNEGHIDRAMNVDLENFQNNLIILDDYKEKPVLLYDNNGDKSKEAAKILQKNGYKKVYNVTEGIKEHNYKLVK